MTSTAHVNQASKMPLVNIIPSERVAWRFPTSDVIGSHLRDDLESYLSLVRRKVQEKYATTRDLIIGNNIFQEYSLLYDIYQYCSMCHLSSLL